MKDGEPNASDPESAQPAVLSNDLLDPSQHSMNSISYNSRTSKTPKKVMRLSHVKQEIERAIKCFGNRKIKHYRIVWLGK